MHRKYELKINRNTIVWRGRSIVKSSTARQLENGNYFRPKTMGNGTCACNVRHNHFHYEWEIVESLGCECECEDCTIISYTRLSFSFSCLYSFDFLPFYLSNSFFHVFYSFFFACTRLSFFFYLLFRLFLSFDSVVPSANYVFQRIYYGVYDFFLCLLFLVWLLAQKQVW